MGNTLKTWDLIILFNNSISTAPTKIPLNRLPVLARPFRFCLIPARILRPSCAQNSLSFCAKQQGSCLPDVDTRTHRQRNGTPHDLRFHGLGIAEVCASMKLSKEQSEELFRERGIWITERTA
jgi:hypothetical protein